MVARKSQPKPIALVFACLLTAFGIIALTWGVRNAGNFDYIVETNAFFAPFEFYEGTEIKGVDVEIIDRVAKKLHKKIKIVNVDFSVIIDNVASGKVADAGAAGLTITTSRSEKVDFSIPYYTSNQYLIYDKTTPPIIRDGHTIFETLANKTVGTQTDTTGYMYVDEEINKGVLKNANSILKGFESAQLAADGIGAKIVDYVVVDELPAKYIVAKNPKLACLPLYYSGLSDRPAAESYAIAVNKQRPELLKAINEVLREMLKKDQNGESEIERLVVKYMGI